METPPLHVLIVDHDHDYFLVLRAMVSAIPEAMLALEWVPDYDTALDLIGRN